MYIMLNVSSVLFDYHFRFKMFQNIPAICLNDFLYHCKSAVDPLK